MKVLSKILMTACLCLALCTAAAAGEMETTAPQPPPPAVSPAPTEKVSLPDEVETTLQTVVDCVVLVLHIVTF